jgi:hypothetical protein
MQDSDSETLYDYVPPSIQTLPRHEERALRSEEFFHQYTVEKPVHLSEIGQQKDKQEQMRQPMRTYRNRSHRAANWWSQPSERPKKKATQPSTNPTLCTLNSKQIPSTTSFNHHKRRKKRKGQE